MTITLDTVTLPDGLLWEDEHAPPIAEATAMLLSGASYVEESQPSAGRPITLKHNGCWVTRATVDSLRVLMTLGRSMTLTWIDGRVFAVRWRYRDGALKVAPTFFYTPPDPSDWLLIDLYLETV